MPGGSDLALYGRRCQVILGTPASPNMAQYGNTGGSATPLRIGFEVEKTAKATPNKCKVMLYNMASETRSNLAPGMICTLSAGYIDGLQTLFLGVVDKAKSDRQAAEIVTTLELLDGGPAISQCTISRTYAKGTTLDVILGDIAQAMQLKTAANPTGITAGCVMGLPQYTSNRAIVLHGSCANALRQVCKPFGLEWSIQNGALQILPIGAATAETAEVLSPSTGLLGVPSVNKTLASFEALLNPRLAPGRAVQLQSHGVNGFFKIRAGKWEGDTHDQKWTCTLEAVALPNAKQVYPAASGFNYAVAVTADALA